MESFQEFNRHKTLLTVRVAEVNVVPGRVVLLQNYGDGREKKRQRPIYGVRHVIAAFYGKKHRIHEGIQQLSVLLCSSLLIEGKISAT